MVKRPEARAKQALPKGPQGGSSQYCTIRYNNMNLLKTCSGAYLMILNNVFYLYIYKKILGYLKYMSILAYIEDI